MEFLKKNWLTLIGGGIFIVVAYFVYTSLNKPEKKKKPGDDDSGKNGDNASLADALVGEDYSFRKNVWGQSESEATSQSKNDRAMIKNLIIGKKGKVTFVENYPQDLIKALNNKYKELTNN